MSKYVTDEAMRSAMTLQKGYIDQGDSNNAEGIDSIKKGKNLLGGVLTGNGPYYNPRDHWGSTSEAVQNPTTLKHEIEVTDGIFSIKETGDNYIVSPAIGVDKGKTYTFRFIYINGGSYEIKIIGVGGYNNHQTQGGGGAGISLTFTAVETESVNIFVRTDDKKLMFPQLELGNHGSQFVASTEDLKDYIDKGDKANAEGIESIEDRMEEVVQTQLITTPPATLNAQVGYYYCMGGSGVVVDTMTIQLPAIADKNKTKNVLFFMTMGSAPEVTFVSAGTERILYQKDFALEAERLYEVNALWNGYAWVITAVEIIVPPFFVKLSLNSGEVVELQGSGELTHVVVSDQYKGTLVSAEIGELCTSIGNGAFNYCEGLTSITIPDSVTSIGESVFQGCSGLTSVTIPNSVTSIGDYAFYQCSGLTSITIPDSVTSIGNNVFYQCTGLTSITSLATTAPTITNYTFVYIKTNGTLYVPVGSTGYDVWMGTGNYYLGKYNWTKVEQ